MKTITVPRTKTIKKMVPIQIYEKGTVLRLKDTIKNNQKGFYPGTLLLIVSEEEIPVIHIFCNKRKYCCSIARKKVSEFDVEIASFDDIKNLLMEFTSGFL